MGNAAGGEDKETLDTSQSSCLLFDVSLLLETAAVLVRHLVQHANALISAPRIKERGGISLAL